MPEVYIGLVHSPVLNRSGDEIATNVTNFDIHDIARICRSYGVKKYFIINRMQEQLMFVSRVLEHWRSGEGSQHNPLRQEALRCVETAESIEKAQKSIAVEALTVATAARRLEHRDPLSFKELKKKIHNQPQKPLFLLFGTGFGLTSETLSHCDALLEPISGAAPDNFNHLPVRSAVSICLDRLLGTW